MGISVIGSAGYLVPQPDSGPSGIGNITNDMGSAISFLKKMKKGILARFGPGDSGLHGYLRLKSFFGTALESGVSERKANLKRQRDSEPFAF